jgi:hypothetical protein
MIIPILVGGGALALGYWLGSRKKSEAKPASSGPAHTTPAIVDSPALPSAQQATQARYWAATQPPETVQWVVIDTGRPPGETVFAMPFPSVSAVAHGQAMFAALQAAGHRNFRVWVLTCLFDTRQVFDLLGGDLSVFSQGQCADVWSGFVGP